MTIAYGKTIVPASFSATLDGVDVTSAFSPVAGSIQSVQLAVTSGTHTLKLAVDGQLPTRTATDTDRLIFIVP